MSYPDESQVAFWRQREAQERAIVANAEGQAKLAHLNLADSYAQLISVATRQKPGEA